MRKSLTFNGIKKPWLYLLEGRSKSPFAPIRNNLLRVKGMPGAYITGTETDVLYISQPIGFVVRDDAHALQIKDELADWLVTDQVAPLQLSDEEGRTYYAKVEGTIEEFTKFVDQRKGVITFICADPFSYGEEKEINLTNVSTVLNDGTADADPIFELEATAPITYAMVQNQHGEYMKIGKPVDVESQLPFQRYENVLQADGSSLVGWTAHDTIDGGSVAGTMETNGTRIQASDYGTGTSWHGPAMKRSLPSPIQDFRLETVIGFWNGQASQVGRVEIYLLDALGNQVAKVAMKDTQNGLAMAVGEARAGDIEGHYLINGTASREDGWNDFYGMLRIEREGNVWNAYIGKINSNGEHTWRRVEHWVDESNLHNRTVAQVVIHVGRFGTYTSGAMGVYSVDMYKINQSPDGIPYIADAGDKITFDHSKNGEVLINGEPYADIDFGSNFFKLYRGLNQITVNPNSFNTTLKYRERYR